MMFSAAARKIVQFTSDGDDWYLKMLINNENVYIRMDMWAALHECPPSWVRCLSPERKGEPRQRQQQSPRHGEVLR